MPPQANSEREESQGLEHRELPGCEPSPLRASPGAPHETRAAFEARATAWEAYTATPLGRLRQELTQHHLAQHLGPTSSQTERPGRGRRDGE